MEKLKAHHEDLSNDFLQQLARIEAANCKQDDAYVANQVEVIAARARLAPTSWTIYVTTTSCMLQTAKDECNIQVIIVTMLCMCQYMYCT